MPIIERTNEIYDQNGLVRVETIQVQVPDVEDQILEKEDELLRIYTELQELKNQREMNQ